MVRRNKERQTFTLSRRQIKILETYAGKNKSKWLGELIEQWYLFNKSELERINNEIRWTQFQKNELEDKLKRLAEWREKLKNRGNYGK